MTGHQGGFTLIEVLVVCFLSSLLLGGFFDVYWHLKENQMSVSSLSLMMGRERALASMIVPAIRQAGVDDCGYESAATTNRLQGYARGEKSPRWLTGRLMSSDALVIQRCRHYRGPRQWVKEAYYIANTRRKDVRGQSIYALYRKVWGGQREELVPDMVQWRCLYDTVRNRDGALDFQPATSVLDWSSVTIVSMRFLLRSSTYMRNAVHCLSFQGERVCADSGIVLRDFPLVVSLRESVL